MVLSYVLLCFCHLSCYNSGSRTAVHGLGCNGGVDFSVHAHLRRVAVVRLVCAFLRDSAVHTYLRYASTSTSTVHSSHLTHGIQHSSFGQHMRMVVGFGAEAEKEVWTAAFFGVDGD